MDFILESREMDDYLLSDKYIDFYNISIQRKADELFASMTDEKERIKRAYEYVRDETRHPMDINGKIMTRCASEVLEQGVGLCLSKSLLLAALLRYDGIPVGLCYQRLMLGYAPNARYLIHGLNAVFLSAEKRWIRLDARGNKQNINAQFSVDEEKIAYPARAENGDVDFPTIYARLPPLVKDALESLENPLEYSFDTCEL